MQYSTTNPLWKVYRVEGGALRKTISFSRHALRIPPALAVDYEILQEARERGCKTIKIYDQESGVYYVASIETMMEKGFPIERGHGRQFALPLSDWLVTSTPEIAQTLRREHHAQCRLL